MAGGKIDILVEPDARQFPSKLGSQLKGAAGPLGAVAKGIGVTVAAGTGLAAVGLAKVIALGIDYQDNLNTLQAVSHATADQMAAVGVKAKALGSDLSLPATSAADAAAAMVELAKGGLSVDQAMTAAKGTLQLAAAAQVDAATAATIQSQALNAFGLSAENAGHVSDVLANAANAASGEITDFAQAMGQVGAVAHQFGLSIDETTTALGLFANAGIKGSDAGTLIKSALLALANPSKPAQKAIEKLGLTTYDATGKFVGLKSIFEQLHAASDKMTDAQYQQATATVFGSDAVRLAGVAANTTGAQWDDMATAIGHAGGASEVAAAKTKGLGGAIEGFKSQLETVALDAFDTIGPPIEAGVRQAAVAVSKYGPVVTDTLEKLVKNGTKVGQDFGPGIAKGVTAGASDLLGAAKRLVSPFVDGAKELVSRGVDVARTAIDGFTDTAQRAEKAVEPLAQGVGRAVSGFAQATGPIGAFRTALEIAYKIAAGTVTVLTPVAAIVGDLIGLFGGLPGPVQTAVAALIALKVGPSILSSLKNAFTSTGSEAEGASGKAGLFGKSVSLITAPARAAASGIASAAGAVRQFTDEAAVQRGIAASAGESIGRMSAAAAAFNTSANPAVSALRNFRDQASGIREAAAGAGTSVSALGAAFGTIVERSAGLSAIRDSFRSASDGATTFKTATGLAAAAGTGLKTAASGIVGALGGPWGIALAGAGVLLSLLASKQEEAKKAAADHKAAVDSLTSAYKASGGAISADIVNQNNKALADANVAANAVAAGSSFQVYTAAANGSGIALKNLSTTSDTAIRGIAKQAGLTQQQTDNLAGLGKSALETGQNYAQLSEAALNAAPSFDSAGTALTNLQGKQKDNFTAIINANGALGKQLIANKEAKDSYLQLAAAEENTSIETIKLMDAQNNQAAAASAGVSANLSYRDAVSGLKIAHDETSEALTKYGKNSREYQAALQQEEHHIIDLVDAKQKDATENSKAASDVGKTNEGIAARNKELITLAQTYKGDLPEALQGLIGKLGSGEAAAAGFQVAVNDAGQAVYKLPDGREILVTANVKPAQDAISALPTYADGVKGAVVISAQTDPATGKITSVVQYADGSTGIVTVDGNKDPATGKVDVAVQYANGQRTFMNIDAFNQAAQDKTIQAVRYADGSVGYIIVKANTDGANAAIDFAARARATTINVRTVLTGPTSSSQVGRYAMTEASGGILQPFAKGGFAEAFATGGRKLKPMRGGIADIVGPNTWRIIGDRLVDDEAYIPINRSGRSVSLLQETAARMGFDLMRRYADGGVAARSATQVSVAAASSDGMQRLVGRLDLGNGLVGFVDARIQKANEATGSAIYQGRRG